MISKNIENVEIEKQLILKRIELEKELIHKLEERYQQTARHFKLNLISRNAYEEAGLEILRQKSNLNELKLKLQNNERSLIEMNQRLRGREYDIIEKRINSQRKISNLDERITDISPDSQQTIFAPISGKITSTQVNIGQTPEHGIPLTLIIPEGIEYKATLIATDNIIGKLKIGMTVNLSYLAYPQEKFGRYEGEIIRISETAIPPDEITLPIALNDPIYLITVKLTQQDVRLNNKTYLLKPGMKLLGSVSIEKITPLQWLIESIKKG